MNAPANLLVAFGHTVRLEGTSVIQRSSAESILRQLLNSRTISCLPAQIATITFEAHPLPLARRPRISLSWLPNRHLSNAEALSILHSCSMLKSGTLSATATISCELRIRVENEINILFLLVGALEQLLGCSVQMLFGSSRVCEMPNQLPRKLIYFGALEIVKLLTSGTENRRTVDNSYEGTLAIEDIPVHRKVSYFPALIRPAAR